LIPAKYALY